MSFWEYDMLAALYCLSPTGLFSSLMVTFGTMTDGLKSLVSEGLIELVPNAQDARTMLVQLTRKGRARIDRAVEAHIDESGR